MFTGIIEEMGQILSKEKVGQGFRIKIKAEKVLEDLAIDNSISVEGVCQTVVSLEGKTFEIEAVEETVSKTTFGALKRTPS